MKSIFISLFTPLLLTATECFAQVSFGNPSKFNDGWKFELSEPGSVTTPESPDSTWRSVVLPHDWSIEGLASPDLASGTGYLPGGVGWYSRHFNYDANAEKGRKKYIYFEGVYNRSEVYLNGNLLGTRPNGYASFMYDLTPYLKDGDNVLSVKVDHSRYADSRYYTGSGIYRDVWMIDAPLSHISQWGIGFETVDVKNGKAEVKVNVAVDNPVKGMKLRTVLTDSEGKVVASATKNVPISSASANTDSNDVVTLRMNIPAVKLWDIDNPYLYTLHTELIDKGKTIDSSDTQVGIRTLAFSPDKGFYLNGRNRKVKGVCIHHDAGMLGAAVPEEVWERRLTNLKNLGVNALRMSHNPQAPVIYDIADRLGLLIMDEASDEWEFPKRKWVKGWNKGKPSFDGSYDFFEEWIDRDVADMVRRDRNHPSVFLWSIGNEVDYPNDPYSHPILDGDNSAISQPMYGGYNPDAPDAMRIGEIAKRLSKVVKGIDTSRPTTGALAGVVMSNQTAYPEAVDVVGYNYTEDRYDTDHVTYPDRVIYGSENRSDYDAWKAVRDKDFIFGQFIWTGIDYLGESGEWPSRGLYTGLLDFTGTPKPRGMFRASLWSDTPMTYIGTYQIPRRPGGNRSGRPEWLSIDAWDSWNYTPGDTIRVVCYTTSPSARLLLSEKPIDGKPTDNTARIVVGEVKQKPDETGIIHWDIPYHPGQLVAEGLAEDGTAESSYTITTSGLPHSLTAHILLSSPTPSNDLNLKPSTLNSKPSALNQIIQVEIDVTDENGIPVKLADNKIEVLIDGGAELMALESADNTDMSNTNYVRFSSLSNGNQSDPRQHWQAKHGSRRAFRGKLLAYVRITDPSQPTTIHVSSPLLQPYALPLSSKP